MKECLDCGHNNPTSHSCCSQCGALLNRSAPQTVQPPAARSDVSVAPAPTSSRPTGFEKLVIKLFEGTFRPIEWLQGHPVRTWVGKWLIQFLCGTTIGLAVMCLLLIVWTFTVVITLIFLYPLWLLLRGLCRLLQQILQLGWQFGRDRLKEYRFPFTQI